MKSIKHTIIFIALLILTSCSNGDNNTNETDTDQFFIGGLICSIIQSDTAENNANTTDQVDCDADLNIMLPGPGVAQNGDGSLTQGNTETLFSAATVDYISSRGLATIDLSLHDGQTRVSKQSSSTNIGTSVETTTRIDWGIYNATVVLQMELSQVGDIFTGGSFDVSNSDVVLFRDLRSDGIITALDEVLEVVSGNINISGAEPNQSVTFTLTLAGNTTLTGFYNGSFYELPSE